ncbi:MAG: hypothetical protein QMD50_03055 [Patescibacteria group bacterium]|nr:hypothetical protein [Patescibacteria group bacterium]
MSLKTFIVIIIVLALVAGAFSFGYYLGNNKGIKEGQKTTEGKLRPIVESFYPKPAQEIKTLNGVIKAISGASLGIEIRDPDDYLPHTDGTPPKTQMRIANVGNSTKIIGITNSLDVNGNLKTISLSLSDLKIGDKVNVTSEQNIKSVKEFIVSKIEVTR